MSETASLPAKPSQKDRRHLRRYPVRWRAVLEIEGRLGSSVGVTVNVSADGCMLLTDHNQPVIGKARLTLQLPPLRPGSHPEIVTLPTRITHTSLSGSHRGFLVGLAFTQPESDPVVRLRHRVGDLPSVRTKP
jgi:hypothetical protein